MKNKDREKDDERDFLIKALHAFISGSNQPEIPDNLDWEQLGRIASRNGLVTILQSSLKIPHNRWARFDDVPIAVFVQYSRALKATVKLFSILDEEGIPAVALRGMALTQWVYPEPVLRPMSDVDILIPAHTRHSLVDRLKAHGLSPVKMLRSQFVYQINDIKFEIHWSFLTPKRYREALDTSGWITSRRLVKTTEGAIYCLSPENELLGLVFHAFIHHELDKLLKLVDIALLCRSKELDWEYLSISCRKAYMTRIFCFTLTFADHIFDLDIETRLSPFASHLPDNAQRVFDAYAERFFGEDSLIHFLHRKKNLLFVAERPTTKLKQLLRFMSAEEMSGLLTQVCRR